MKSFFRNVLANIVAIIIIAAVFSLFLVMIITASALSGDQKPNIKNNTVLTLDFKTNIIDSPTEDQQELFAFSDKQKNILIYDMLEAIKKAKTDDKIKGISLETDGMRLRFFT